jgi:hypothetical protein
MTDNETVIEDVGLEQRDSAGYYMECCEFLEDFITKRPKVAATEVQAALGGLLKVLRSDPKSRDFSSVDAVDRLVRPFLFDNGSISQPEASVAAALLLFGMAGKSLYFLSKQTHNPQFETEIGRLFKDLNEVRSNVWLFHVSAQMMRMGFEIRFITECEQQTPDFLAIRGDTKIYVEANTCNPTARGIDGIKNALWNVLHGDAKSSGKQIKFTDAAYDPGLIVVDVSNCDVDSNETGLPAQMKLRLDALTVTEYGRIYDLSSDPEFFDQKENTGNLIEYAIRYFHQMAEYKKYRVRALLIGISMGVRTAEKGALGSPKGAIMIVDSRYPQLALQELATQIYLVYTQSPLPLATQ